MSMLIHPEAPPVLVWFYATPLHIVWAAHQAVVFFFVLSGFVLALPFLSGRSSVIPFLIRRVCRLGPPFLGSVLVGLLLMSVVPHPTMPSISAVFNSFWSRPLAPADLWKYLSVLGDVRYDQVNPVLWSLVIEMRLSLAFPLIMLVVIRQNGLRVMGAGFVLALIATHFSAAQADLLATLQYLWIFVGGAVLARHKDRLVAYCRAQGTTARLAWIGLGLILYTAVFWLTPMLPRYSVVLDDGLTGLGAAIFVIEALAWSAMARVLLIRPLQLLGKMAYSVYLFHILVLLTLAHLLYGHLPLWVIWLLALGASLVVSATAYRALEVPAMAFGRRLSQRFSRRGESGRPGDDRRVTSTAA